MRGELRYTLVLKCVPQLSIITSKSSADSGLFVTPLPLDDGGNRDEAICAKVLRGEGSALHKDNCWFPPDKLERTALKVYSTIQEPGDMVPCDK